MASDPYGYPPAKPTLVTTIGILFLIGGITALAVGGGLLISCIGVVWPGTYYSIALGALALVKASKLLGDRPPSMPPPKLTAALQICNIINLDLINVGLGIANLVLLNDSEVKDYFYGQSL